LETFLLLYVEGGPVALGGFIFLSGLPIFFFLAIGNLESVKLSFPFRESQQKACDAGGISDGEASRSIERLKLSCIVSF
jgi:hypothetical protein